jgi:outer membrane lipoprotein-sorting protein
VIRALQLVALTATSASADPTLAKIEGAYANATQVEGNFTKTVVNKTFNNKVVTQGTFAAERPSKIAFDFLDKKNQPANSFKYDGKTGWMIKQQNLEAIRQDLAASDLPAAISFLTGKKGELAKTHEVTSTASSVTLTPNKPQAAYSKIELVFDPKTYTVTKSIVSAPEGDITYEYSGVNLAAKVAPERFTFDPKKHPTFKISTPRKP